MSIPVLIYKSTKETTPIPDKSYLTNKGLNELYINQIKPKQGNPNHKDFFTGE